jgi:hypothetical protein
LLEDTKADLELLQEELREMIHKVYPGPYNREKRAIFLQDGTGLEDVQTRPQQAERVAVPTPKRALAFTFRNRTFARC